MLTVIKFKVFIYPWDDPYYSAEKRTNSLDNDILNNHFPALCFVNAQPTFVSSR